jgi:hypothetical protein
MNRQEYLDLLIKTSRDGKFPSRCEDERGPDCRYRTPDGERQCAVGLLIPPEKYVAGMECGCAHELFRKFPSLETVVPEGLTVDDLREVQMVHDRHCLWDHEKFVLQLMELECFQGLCPSDGEQNSQERCDQCLGVGMMQTHTWVEHGKVRYEKCPKCKGNGFVSTTQDKK